MVALGKFGILGVILLITSLSAPIQIPQTYLDACLITCPMHVSNPDTCPMHSSSQAKAGEFYTAAAHNHSQDPDDQDQDPPPQPSPPPHKPSEGDGCSRPRDDNPDKGVESNTVGCLCVRKTPCNNGQPKEDPGSPDDNYKTRCKNWCYKDRCHCPNPCKS